MVPGVTVLPALCEARSEAARRALKRRDGVRWQPDLIWWADPAKALIGALAPGVIWWAVSVDAPDRCVGIGPLLRYIFHTATHAGLVVIEKNFAV